MDRNLLTPLVDSHCHLDFPDFDDDLDLVVKRAEDAGISNLVTICTKPQNLSKVLKIVSRYPNIYFAAGSHPLNKYDNEKFTKQELLEASNDPKMVGIGETGLDYFYSSLTSIDQKKHFRLHIELARKCSLPLIIHSRSADQDMIKILTEEYERGSFECVLHCFSSGSNLASVAIELGFYISISGIFTFPKSEDLRKIIKTIPLDRLLIETDSPYLAPQPVRGKRNEPSFVALTAKIVAEHIGISEDCFRERTTQNFHQLFKKIKT